MSIKINNRFSFIIILFISLLILGSCTQKKAADIVYKGDMFYGKDKIRKSATSRNYITAPDGREVKKLRRKKQKTKTQQTKNSTKKTTAKKVVKPKYHTVKSGDSLYTIAKKYEINTTSLIEKNDLKKPYIIKPGQKLKLPSSASSQSIAKKVKATTKTVKSTKKQIFKKTGKFIWPVKGKVISKFGPKAGGLHNDGINIASKMSTPIKAANDGVIAYTGNELRGYGNLIIIKHYNNWISAYAHCEKYSVKRGEKVIKGQTIGLVGKSGNAKSPQLYFGLRKGRKAVDPLNYLK